MYSNSAKSILNKKRERAANGSKYCAAGWGSFAIASLAAPQRIGINLLRTALGHHFWGLITKFVRVILPQLLAAAVTVQIAICANVDYKIEDIGRAPEMSRQFIALRPAANATSNSSLRLALGPLGDEFIQLSIRPIRYRVQQVAQMSAR